MIRKTIPVLALVVLSLLAAVPASYATRGGDGGRGDGPVIYVRSQGLYYDSIVSADPVPQRGRFQKLEMGPHGLETDFGPGDPGHLGGRWWLDLNGNNKEDGDDKFFLCPLLGPGRSTP